MREQQHEIGPHDRFRHIENPVVMHDVMEGAVAAQPIGPAPVQMRIDDPVGLGVRVAAQHPLDGGLQGLDLAVAEAETGRHRIAVPAIGLDLRFRQHRRLLPRKPPCPARPRRLRSRRPAL